MLSDWHPKGRVSSLYGAYNAEAGNPIRSVFIIDPEGIVRWAMRYPPGEGLPTAQELLAEIDGRRHSEGAG